MTVLLKRECGNAAIGGDVLILFADGFAQEIHFNVTRLFGNLPLLT
jgi:hypothetical protein